MVKNEGEGSQKSVRIVGEAPSGRPVLKKSLLKSISSGSVDKAGEKAGGAEVRAPSPIPEDPREDNVERSPPGKAALAKKPSDAKPSSQEQGDKKASADDEEKKKKEEEEERQKKEEEEKKKEEEEKKKKETPKPAPREDNVPVATTQLRGKSKATGQIMGGWI